MLVSIAFTAILKGYAIEAIYRWVIWRWVASILLPEGSCKVFIPYRNGMRAIRETTLRQTTHLYRAFVAGIKAWQYLRISGCENANPPKYLVLLAQDGQNSMQSVHCFLQGVKDLISREAFVGKLLSRKESESDRSQRIQGRVSLAP